MMFDTDFCQTCGSSVHPVGGMITTSRVAFYKADKFGFRHDSRAWDDHMVVLGTLAQYLSTQAQAAIS